MDKTFHLYVFLLFFTLFIILLPSRQFIRRRSVQISYLFFACDHPRILRFGNPKPDGSRPRLFHALQSPDPLHRSRSDNFRQKSADTDSDDNIRRFLQSPASARSIPLQFQKPIFSSSAISHKAAKDASASDLPKPKISLPFAASKNLLRRYELITKAFLPASKNVLIKSLR